MIPKDMKLTIQILDKLQDDEIGMLNDMMKWKAQRIFEDFKNQLGKFIMKFRDQCAGETDIEDIVHNIEERHLSNYEPIGSSLNKGYEVNQK